MNTRIEIAEANRDRAAEKLERARGEFSKANYELAEAMGVVDKAKEEKKNADEASPFVANAMLLHEWICSSLGRSVGRTVNGICIAHDPLNGKSWSGETWNQLIFFMGLK